MTSAEAVPRRARPRPLTLAALAVVGVVPFVVLRLSLRPVDDADAFWHVLSGRNVWRTGDVVVEDPFGRFSANEWVQLDWLSDLVMAGAFAAGGYPALAWLYTVLGITLFGVLYLAARRHAGPPTAGLVAVLGWAGTYASQGFRPQTVSFVLLALTLLAWDRVRSGHAGTPWWLVPLTWVWACSHGLWFLGPLAGAAVVAGLAVDRARDRRTLLRLAAVPVAGLVAGALTPVGPRLLAAPLTVLAYADLVTEWRPPDIHEPYVAATVGLVAVTALGWARARERPSGHEVLLWLMALGWTLLYARTVAVGAVIAAPLAARALAGLLPVPADGAARRAERLAVLGGCLAAAAVAAVLAPGVAARPGGVPTRLGPALEALPAGTVVLNDDGVGGWLLLEHPRLHPVIDTRTYLFDVPYIRAYQAARGGLRGWPAFVERTGATAALLREGDPLLPLLGETLGWREEAHAEGFVLSRPPGPAR